MDLEKTSGVLVNVEQLWNRHYMILLVVNTLINTSSFILITLLPLHMVSLGGNNVSAGTLMMIFTFYASMQKEV